MRANPKVCVEADEIRSQTDWMSVVVEGEYEELPEARHPEAYAGARKLLDARYRWWSNAFAGRRMTTTDLEIKSLFFRIRINSMTGLRGSAEIGYVDSSTTVPDPAKNRR
jgi:uncharacterized protein